MIFVDSSVLIDFFRGAGTPEADRLDALLASEPLVTGDLVLTEVLQGFASESDCRRAHDLLSSLTVIQLCGRNIAVKAARNHRRLRALGMTVRKTIDTVIATRCIADDLALLYTDRDFEPFVKHLGLRSAMSDR